MITDKLLISLDDIKKVRPAAEGISAAQINPFIREAQRLDLRPLLGDALYYDFIQNFDVTSYNVSAGQNYTNYQTLINGEPYTYGGATVVYQGLVEMLCYFTLARFVPNNIMSLTRFGLVQKVNDQSTPVDARTLANFVSELRAVAIQYGNQLTQYLYMNQVKFVLYPQLSNENMNKVGAKFFDPDKGAVPNGVSKMYPYNLR